MLLIVSNMTFYVLCFRFSFLAAIIGIIGCADALKATSLFSRNANKTTTTASTTTTIAAIAADAVKDDEVWILFAKLITKKWCAICII